MALGHWLKDYIGPRGSSASGGGTEPIVLHEIEEEGVIRLDKTFGEIKEAYFSGIPMIIVQEDEFEDYAYSVTFVGSYFNDPDHIGTVEIRKSTPVQYKAIGATAAERDAAYPGPMDQ